MDMIHERRETDTWLGVNNPDEFMAHFAQPFSLQNNSVQERLSQKQKELLAMLVPGTYASHATVIYEREHDRHRVMLSSDEVGRISERTCGYLELLRTTSGRVVSFAVLGITSTYRKEFPNLSLRTRKIPLVDALFFMEAVYGPQVFCSGRSAGQHVGSKEWFFHQARKHNILITIDPRVD